MKTKEKPAELLAGFFHGSDENLIHGSTVFNNILAEALLEINLANSLF